MGGGGEGCHFRAWGQWDSSRLGVLLGKENFSFAIKWRHFFAQRRPSSRKKISIPKGEKFVVNLNSSERILAQKISGKNSVQNCSSSVKTNSSGTVHTELGLGPAAVQIAKSRISYKK